MFSYTQYQTYYGYASALSNELQNQGNMYEHNEIIQNLELAKHLHHGHIKIEFDLSQLQSLVHIELYSS